MTINELEKAANAINKRLDTLVKNYGSNNYAVKQLQTMINANFKGATYTTKSGQLHISRSAAKLAKVTNSAAKFEKMFNAPTVSSVNAKAAEILKEQGIDNPTRSEIRAQVEAMDNAEQIINDNAYKYNTYSDSDLQYAKDTLHITGRRKTWEEIGKICEILQRDYSDKNIEQPVNEFAESEGLYR